MKKLFLVAAAAAVVGFAVPASAQVNVRAGDHGVKVRVGPGHPHHHGHARSHWRGHHARGDCRVIRSKTVTPGGRVIIKTRQVCR
ncbi:hypothetical protein [Pseudorhodoplanes sp.]|jgi:hypothetical protein|uniref:hypothetical protein n=1 Tax=Pseudorhodoplanes sp. TaxID=1934341 RepID=UPI002CBA6F90|nr:hypothetical protein [Pseudorhodoplanes sp.]HWV40366.1 hypothetical protein [Pseudorhodoplanes sp.]